VGLSLLVVTCSLVQGKGKVKKEKGFRERGIEEIMKTGAKRFGLNVKAKTLGTGGSLHIQEPEGQKRRKSRSSRRALRIVMAKGMRGRNTDPPGIETALT